MTAESTSKFVRVQETRLLMGSVANMTLISDAPQQAHDAIRASFERMAILENIFSRHRPHSQLSQLNTTGYLEDVHPAMREVLSRAIDYGYLTDGAFDITIEPLARLYRNAVRAGDLPDTSQVEAMRQLVDYQQIKFEGTRVAFGKQGMAISLDGIAKGYIIDQGVAILRDHGFGNSLVEVGGDLQARGKADNRAWQIGIHQPVAVTPPNHQRIAQLENVAMATSGDYHHSFTQDRRLHHILDARTGISPTQLSSVSVIAPNLCDADAIATALMVMGKEAGFALIHRLEDFEALTISKQGQVEHTSHFPIRLV